MNTPSSRVLRGGSFVNEDYLRAASRSGDYPGLRYGFIGFRLVLRCDAQRIPSLADRMEAFLLLAAPLIAPCAGPTVAERLARAARLLRLPGYEKTDTVS